MFKQYKILLASFIFLCLICITIVQAKAQGNPIEAEILPAQGNANTTILIRFNTKNATIGNVDKADIFWDDSTIGLNQQGVLGADGSYNYNLTVPTEPPFSDVGNHTIRVDSSVFNYGRITFNFTFTVTEFVPSFEYLALNATYYSLLANYTDLFDNYNQLVANYTKTSTDYATLLNEYNQLLLNYNSLAANYNSLTANYNSLTANYNSLTANYNSLTANYNLLLTEYNSLHQISSSLLANYTSLQANFQSLTANYNALTQDLDSLHSSYDDLKSNYDAVHGQLTFSRNLNYILIASTTTLAVTSIYLVTRRPKPVSKTRY